MSKLTEAEVLKLGAVKGPYDKVPSLRFDEAAGTTFLEWRGDLERRLRSDELSPALEGHFAKYRKLVPALALIDHLVEGGVGFVGCDSLDRALALAEYLETHAKRVYGATEAVALVAAESILAHIRKGDLQDGFTARDVHRHEWSRLTDIGHVHRGLDLLVEFDHLAAEVTEKSRSGGRPKVSYRVNPATRS